MGNQRSALTCPVVRRLMRRGRRARGISCVAPVDAAGAALLSATIRSRASRNRRTRRTRSRYEIGLIYEMVYNLFVTAGVQAIRPRAQNINTIDEVPDSSWFTNRIGIEPITADESRAAPIAGAPPDPSRWVLIREKTAGIHPGFTARDAKGETWFLEFDSPGPRKAATGVRGGRHEDLLGTWLQPGRNATSPRSIRSAWRSIPRRRSGGPPARGRRSRTTTSTRFSNASRATRTAPIAHRRPPDSGRSLGSFMYRRHAARRSQRRRAARTPPRAARAPCLRCMDEPHRSQGGEHARRARTDERPLDVKHYLQDVGSTFGMCERSARMGPELGILLRGRGHERAACFRSALR